MVSWAIQALTLHRATDMHLLTPWAAASLARNDAIGHAALRRWRVAGPFEDANATGLERSFPPEAATLDPNQSFKSGWGAADVAAGAPTHVSWQPANLPPTGSAVALELPFHLPSALSNRSVAVAAATFSVPAGGAATLRVSTSQQAVVILNGALVGVKKLAAGVLPSDGEWSVELRPGANTLMLRLMLHYGAYEVGGEVHESATEFCAGLWQSSGEPLQFASNATGLERSFPPEASALDPNQSLE